MMPPFPIDSILIVYLCISRLSDVTLSLLLSVKSSLLCGEKFNVKIDDFRFVGFPVSLEDMGDKTGAAKSGHRIISFNVAFVLQVSELFCHYIATHILTAKTL